MAIEPFGDDLKPTAGIIKATPKATVASQYVMRIAAYKESGKLAYAETVRLPHEDCLLMAKYRHFELQESIKKSYDQYGFHTRYKCCSGDHRQFKVVVFTVLLINAPDVELSWAYFPERKPDREEK